jgi:hypothetical protein
VLVVAFGRVERLHRLQPGQVPELVALEEDPAGPVPGFPSGTRRRPAGTRAVISRIAVSASARLTLPLKWT